MFEWLGMMVALETVPTIPMAVACLDRNIHDPKVKFKKNTALPI